MATTNDTSLERGSKTGSGSSELQFLSGCSSGKKVRHECEVVLETEENDNLDNRYQQCPKHPGHQEFIRVKNFKMNDLPLGQRTPEMMEDAFMRCALTVRVKVTYTSLQRPTTFADSKEPYPYSKYRGSNRSVRYGTGSIVYIFFHHSVKGKPCPCKLCKKPGSNPKMEFWWVQARTATHVIHDQTEAENAEIDCFYDSDDRKSVKTIYGFDTCNLLGKSTNTYRNDVCDILCVTHDPETAALLNGIIPSLSFLKPIFFFGKNPPAQIIVSHPHGCSKRITVGNILHLTVPTGLGYPVATPILFKKGTVYRKSLLTNQEDPNNTENNSMGENEVAEPNYLNFQEKLEAIKASLKTVNYSESETYLPINSEKSYSKEDYVFEFYSLYLREQCLRMILICALVDVRNNSEEYHIELLTKMALDSVLKVFLLPIRDVTAALEQSTKFGTDGRNKSSDTEGSKDSVEASSSVTPESELDLAGTSTKKLASGSVDGNPEDTKQNMRQGKGTRGQTSDEKLEGNSSRCDTEMLESLWLEVLRKSDEDFEFYKNNRSSYKATDISFLVSWYDKMEQIVFSRLDKIRETDKDAQERTVREGVGLSLKAGYDMLSEIEKTVCRDPDSSQTATGVGDDVTNAGKKGALEEKNVDVQRSYVEKDGNKPHTDSGNEEISEKKQSTKSEIPITTAPEKGEDIHDAKTDGIHSKGDKIEQKEEEAETIVEDGTAFILPSDAEYAFRVYSRHPGWINFPPGTEIISPTGNRQTVTGEPSSLEFKHPAVQPELCYVTYNTDTCPGSSGANVYCDILGQYLGTYFPHSGNVEGGINQSGVRDNMYTLYYKLFCFKPKFFSGSNGPSDKTMSILKTSKALFGSFLKV